MKNQYTIILLFVISLIMGTSVAAESKTLVLRWADMSPASGVRPEYLKKAAAEIEKATDGRVKIEFYWSNSLVNVSNNVKAVQSGVADMAWTMPIYHPAEYPLGLVSQTVLSAPKSGDTGFIVKAFWDMWDESKPLRDEVDKWGSTVWFMFPYGGYGCYAKKPIKKIEDFKGLRLRVSSEGIGKMVSAVGAHPEFTAASEVYTALEKNMFDGAVCGYEWGRRYSLYEVSDHLNLIDSCMIGCAYGIVSKKALKKMSEDDRKVFMEIGRRVSIEYGEAINKQKESDIQTMKDNGMKLIQFPAAEMKRWEELKGIKALIPEWLEQQEREGRGEDAKEIMKIFLEKFEISHLSPE